MIEADGSRRSLCRPATSPIYEPCEAQTLLVSHVETAQITTTLSAMMRMDHRGYHGIHRKFAMMASAAMTIALTRAHVAPVSRPMPTRTTTMPRTRWIQPHVVRSNC